MISIFLLPPLKAAGLSFLCVKASCRITRGLVCPGQMRNSSVTSKHQDWQERYPLFGHMVLRAGKESSWTDGTIVVWWDRWMGG